MQGLVLIIELIFLPFSIFQYLKHFFRGVTLRRPYQVVRVLQEILEGVEGLVLGGHGQEGGVGGGETLEQEDAPEYHQGKDNST